MYLPEKSIGRRRAGGSGHLERHPRCLRRIRDMRPVAAILRQSLIELDACKTTRDGQETKMELVYQYLTGPRFRHRVEAIVLSMTPKERACSRSTVRQATVSSAPESR